MPSVSHRRERNHVVGASVLPRVLALSAEAFNEYLRSDGIPDVLDARHRSAELGNRRVTGSRTA